MKNKYINQTMALGVALLLSSQMQAQHIIGKAKEFANLINANNSSQRVSKFTFELNENTTVNGEINYRKALGEGFEIAGKGNDQSATFNFNTDANGRVKGNYYSLAQKIAYNFVTDDNGNLVSNAVDINNVVCIEYNEIPKNETTNTNQRVARTTAIPKYESLPGATAVIYIDLDGEVSQSSSWNNGQTINAASFNFTDAEVKTVYDIVAQDFITFNVNVTTDLNVFLAAPKNRRMRCICTPTTTAAPGAGGVAMINSFTWGTDTPCWVFNDGAKGCGETVSHEIGHTLGLRHDGTPSLGYYSGHSNWAPIMGSSFTRAIGHWSLGEYTGANNKEDDINIIGTKNGFTPKTDDIGNTNATAKNLVISSTGTVTNTNNKGIINNRNDIDIFKFTAATNCNINLSIIPAPLQANLNIKARLLDATGKELLVSDPANTLSATLTSAVTAGTYYIEIDGVGNGANPQVGYSDYSSIGDYYISGTAPTPDPKPTADFTSLQTTGCEGLSVNFTDKSTNTPTSWKWTFTGGNITTSTSQNPTVIYNKKGTYRVSLRVTNNFGRDSITKNAYIIINGADLPQTSNVSLCAPGGSTILTATPKGSNTINWYKDSSYTNVLFTGNSLTTNVTQNSTFYTAATTIPAAVKLGPADKNIGTGADHAGGQSLIFSALKSFTLKSVKVYAVGSKNRTIQVKDSSGNIISEKTIMINDGESRVTLDFNIPTGTNHEITVGTGSNLFRNDAGVNFPYKVANVAEITKSTAAGVELQYYYYFYDWEIQENSGCYSALVPVKVTIETCTGTESFENETITIYPNPSNGSFTVKTPSNKGEVTVINNIGEIVNNIIVSTDSTTINNLSKGLYIVKYLSNGKVTTQKVVIQ